METCSVNPVSGIKFRSQKYKGKGRKTQTLKSGHGLHSKLSVGNIELDGKVKILGLIIFFLGPNFAFPENGSGWGVLTSFNPELLSDESMRDFLSSKANILLEAKTALL